LIHTTPNFTVSSTLTEDRHLCKVCGKDYSQPQGVSRHRREAHGKPNSCTFRAQGCNFTWTRPYLYMVHLETRHAYVNPSKVQGRSARSRRRFKSIERKHFPPPAGRRSRVEPRQRPLTPVAYDAPPKYAELAITTREYELARGFEAPNAPFEFPPTDELALSRNDLDIANHGGQIRLVHAFYMPHM
jgi:hypothetical protein